MSRVLLLANRKKSKIEPYVIKEITVTRNNAKIQLTGNNTQIKLTGTIQKYN